MVTAEYSDSSTANVTNSCTITPAAGKAFVPGVDNSVTITYENQSTILTLNEAVITGLTIVSQNPWEIAAIWSDGSYTDVTDLCTFTYDGNTVLIEYDGFSITGELTIESTDPLSVIMEYSDGSEFDVTEDCQITYNGYEIIVEYEDLIVSTWLVASNLQIVTPPTKTSYIANEEIDYSGIVVKYVHSDGSEHDVTNYCDFDPASGTVITQTTYATISCAPPLEPYVYDQNSGYINNGIWQVENPTGTYIDIYEVQAGHKYWLTLGATVGSRFRAMFTTTDISQASSNVTGTSIINANNPATYASATYTPSSNGYIAVAKDNVGVSGLYTYLFDTSATSKTESVTLPLSVATLASIAVTTMPDQTDYRDGAAIDFSGIAITATMSDGGTRPVNAEDCTFSPVEGTAFDSSSPVVTVSYELGGIIASTTFELGLVALTGITIGTLLQSNYGYGETLILDGTPVTANYSDNSTEDVTLSSGVSFSPASGTLVTVNTDTTITVTYTNAAGETATEIFSITITPSKLIGIMVTAPIKTSYQIGDTIDYTGLQVFADYSNGAQIDVTDEATMSPPNGITLTNNILMTASYGGFIAALNNPQVTSIQELNHFELDKVTYIDADIYYGYTNKYPFFLTRYTEQKNGWIIEHGFDEFRPKSYRAWSVQFNQGTPAAMELSREAFYSGGWFWFDGDDNSGSRGASRSKVVVNTQETYRLIYENYGYHSFSVGDLGIVYISDLGIPSSHKIANSGALGYTSDKSMMKYTDLSGYQLNDENDLTLKLAYTTSLHSSSDYSMFLCNKKENYSITPVSTYNSPTSCKIKLRSNSFVAYKLPTDDTNGWQRIMMIQNLTGYGALALKDYSNVLFWGKNIVKNFEGNDCAKDVLMLVYSVSNGTLSATVFNVLLRDALIRIKVPVKIYVASEPTKTIYAENELLDTTGLVVKAAYTDGSEEDVTNSVILSPNAGSNIIQDSTTVEVSYTESGVYLETEFTVIIGRVQSLSVAFLPAYSDPNGMDCYNRAGRRLYYTPGEDFTVTATMIDGTTIDVTNDCEYSPSSTTSYGSPVWNYNDTVVTATYTAGNTITIPIEFPNNYKFAPYTITPPTKTNYRVGEALDLTGADLQSGFTYTNGDLLSEDWHARISNSEIIGDFKGVNEFEESYGATPQIITENTSRIWSYLYLEDGEYVSAYFDITVATLRSIAITPPTKTTYIIGENIDYSGIIVTANYSDGSSDDVTAVTADTLTTITVSYTNIGGETATATFEITI